MGKDGFSHILYVRFMAVNFVCRFISPRNITERVKSLSLGRPREGYESASAKTGRILEMSRSLIFPSTCDLFEICGRQGNRRDSSYDIRKWIYDLIKYNYPILMQIPFPNLGRVFRSSSRTLWPDIGNGD